MIIDEKLRKRREYQKNYNKIYRIKNRDKCIKSVKNWRVNHPNYVRDYNLKNKEKIRSYRKKYDKEYRRKNIEKLRIQDKQYYQDHKEQYRQYHKNNPEIRFKANMKQLKKLGNNLNMDHFLVRYALVDWGKSIRKRDPYCKMGCGNKSEIAHHILYKSKYPKLSLDLDNGVGLCKECHYTYHDLNGWR